jgi:hypothetical protein
VGVKNVLGVKNTDELREAENTEANPDDDKVTTSPREERNSEKAESNSQLKVHLVELSTATTPVMTGPVDELINTTSATIKSKSKARKQQDKQQE